MALSHKLITIDIAFSSEQVAVAFGKCVSELRGDLKGLSRAAAYLNSVRASRHFHVFYRTSKHLDQTWFNLMNYFNLSLIVKWKLFWVSNVFEDCS